MVNWCLCCYYSNCWKQLDLQHLRNIKYVGAKTFRVKVLFATRCWPSVGFLFFSSNLFPVLLTFFFFLLNFSLFSCVHVIFWLGSYLLFQFASGLLETYIICSTYFGGQSIPCFLPHAPYQQKPAWKLGRCM